jgi:hypothetical protein
MPQQSAILLRGFAAPRELIPFTKTPSSPAIPSAPDAAVVA